MFKRFNSTIKVKFGLCLDCTHGVEQPLIAGRCPYHNKKYRYEENAKKAKERYARQLEEPLGVSGKQSELVLWYSARIRERSGICMECLAPIPARYSHASIAHICDKAHFPSVATALWNFLELGAGCGCHAKFDSAPSNAAKMKVAKIAKERFKTFDHLIISPEERRRIPEFLLNY